MAIRKWIGNGGVTGDLNDTDNWTGGAVPTTGDDAVFENNNVDVTLNLTQLTDALASVTIKQSYTGKIGTDVDQVQTYMTTDAPIVNIGVHEGPGTPSGSPQMLIDCDDAAGQTITIDGTGASSNANKPALRLKGSAQDHILLIRGGSIGICVEEGEAMTVTSLEAEGPANVLINDGVTLGTAKTITNRGATIEFVGETAAAVIANHSGIFNVNTALAIASIATIGGTVNVIVSGVITANNVSGGFMDASKAITAVTITDTTVNSGGRFAKNDNVTLTNAPTTSNIFEIKGR